MKFIQYLKERWITYVFISLAFGFAATVYGLDQSFQLTQSNAGYIMAGWGLLLLGFLILDYWVFATRLMRMKKYCKRRASSEEQGDFWYPVDQEYGSLIDALVGDYEKYRAEVGTKASETMDFITKWVHDTKVPIAALRLILEDQEENIPSSLYQSMDRELLSIEESVQQVLYEMKTNTFYDDYKLARVSTTKLVAQALKGYSSFFSYKKLNITIEGEAYEVLTDEKWSGYILSQLISNAVKHTPDSGTITIQTSNHANETTITVQNTGQGILSEDLGQVFRQGYTASENRNGTKATGYGLYLSKKLSNRLGHRLTADASYGQFARFHLTFIKNETIHHVTKM